MNIFSERLTQLVGDFGEKRATHIPKLSKYAELYTLLLKETSFLDEYFPSIPQRIWHVKNGTNTVKICTECNKNVLNWNPGKSKYRDFCSLKCKSNNIEIKQKTKDSFIRNFGCDNPQKNKEIKEKTKLTNLTRYGFDNPLKSNVIRDKVKKTKKEKYGDENFTNPNKRTKTNIERYGVKSFAESLCDKISLEKVRDKDFLYEQHILLKKTQDKIAKDLNLHPSTISFYLKENDITPMRFSRSEGEKELGEFVENFFEIQTNVRNIIFPKEIDILIPAKNIAIEYCGLYWHSFEINNNVNFHKQKYDLCKEKGLRLITIFEDEWINKKEIVKNKLMHILGVSFEKKIFARKCVIKNIDFIIAKKFHDENHIQGFSSGFFHAGLFFENELISCISLKRRNTRELEIVRYSTNCRVVGGFSKLLSYIIKELNFDSVVTFADLRWHQGEVYFKSGFTLEKQISPDYQYITNHFTSRSHKFNFRKKTLEKKFKDLYDETLTEFENVKKMKIYRIYDCGKLKYIYNKGK